MGKMNRAFDNVNTIEDFKADITENVEYLNNGYFNEEKLEVALATLKNPTPETEQDILRFIHHVDKRLSAPGAAVGNRFHKLPTIMSGCIYLTHHRDKIKDLSSDELIILSMYSIVYPTSHYENSLDTLGKDLLTAIANKDPKWEYQSLFLNYAVNKISTGENNQQVAEYITNTPLEELQAKVIEHNRKIFQEEGIYL